MMLEISIVILGEMVTRRTHEEELWGSGNVLGPVRELPKCNQFGKIHLLSLYDTYVGHISVFILCFNKKSLIILSYT